MAVNTVIPVITLDGAAATGKGSVAQAVAAELGFHYLDSGKLYRAVALAARQHGIAANNNSALARLFQQLTQDNRPLLRYLQQEQDLIRPEVSQQASLLAKNPALRDLLLPLQRAERRTPGLVADGRDMATVVFPDACLRIFLQAALTERAKRRLAQLRDRGIYAKISDVCADMAARDAQDQTRAVAPLKPHPNALVIDATHQSISDIAACILRAYRSIASCHTVAES